MVTRQRRSLRRLAALAARLAFSYAAGLILGHVAFAWVIASVWPRPSGHQAYGHGPDIVFLGVVGLVVVVAGVLADAMWGRARPVAKALFFVWVLALSGQLLAVAVTIPTEWLWNSFVGWARWDLTYLLGGLMLAVIGVADHYGRLTLGPRG